MDLAYALNYIRDAEHYLRHQERLVASLHDLGQDTEAEIFLLEYLRQALQGYRLYLFDMIVEADLSLAPDVDKKFAPRRI
jgi:hypothetical protein